MTLADSEAGYIARASACMSLPACSKFPLSVGKLIKDAQICAHIFSGLARSGSRFQPISHALSFFRVACPHTYAPLCQRPTEKAFKKEEKLARRQKINRKKINVHKTVDFDKRRNTLLEA